LRGVDAGGIRRRADHPLRRLAGRLAGLLYCGGRRGRGGAPHAAGAPRTAWRCLSIALALYFVGTVIGVNSWLHGQDPFPGVADVFYVAFYPAFFAAVGS
jgi:hypothetical protein